MAKNKNIPKVYAYGLINDDMIGNLVRDLQFYSEIADSIDLHMNSVGGSVSAGVAGYNAILSCSVPVDVYVDGAVASFASVMALAGRKLYMNKYSRMMLHEARVMEGGTADELESSARQVKACNGMMLDMVCAKTGMAEAEAQERFFNGSDNWFDADEAVSLKLADDIKVLPNVRVPKAANHIEVYAVLDAAYQNGIFKTEEYMEIKLSNEAVATLDLRPGYDVNAVNTAVLTLARERDAANEELEQVRKEYVTKEVTGLIAAAFDAKKISAQQKAVFAKKFAEDPEGLKEMLSTMGAFVNVNAQLHQQSVSRDGNQGSYGPQVVALMAEGWDKLDRTNRLTELKRLDEGAFLAMYEGHFGYKPNERPRTDAQGKVMRR